MDIGTLSSQEQALLALWTYAIQYFKELFKQCSQNCHRGISYSTHGDNTKWSKKLGDIWNQSLFGAEVHFSQLKL